MPSGHAQASDLGSILRRNDQFQKGPAGSIHPPASPDHGAHPDYLEWRWYLTGNLKDEQDAATACNGPLFRQGIEQEITWRTLAHPQLWLAQFAITGCEQAATSRTSAPRRQGPVRRCQSGRSVLAQHRALAFKEKRSSATLAAEQDGILDAGAPLPAVLQGKQGYSEKSPAMPFYHHPPA